MMRLPSLGRLTLSTGAFPLNELPPDLLERLLGIIDADHPCAEVVKLCGINREWLGWCRSGWLYDAANRALGFYGRHATFEEVLAVYKALKVDPPGATPKAYFQYACLARFDHNDNLMGVAQWHPFYEARLLHQVRTHGYPGLENIPTHLSNYGAIAKASLRRSRMGLQFVPTDRADYGEIAKVAVQTSPRQLERVPSTRDDFVELAKIALQRDPYALYTVPRDHPGYGELAKLAVQVNPPVLSEVDKSNADFGEIALAALQRDGLRLVQVPQNRADYDELARVAFAQNEAAFQWMRVEMPDYAEFALRAIAWDPNLVRYVNVASPRLNEIYWAALRAPGDDAWRRIRHVRPRPGVEWKQMVRYAVAKNPNALDEIYSPSMPRQAYEDAAKAAVSEDWRAIQHIDHGQSWALMEELGRIAIEKDWHAMEYLFQYATRRDSESDRMFRRLAALALEKDREAQRWVRWTDPRYVELAKMVLKAFNGGGMNLIPASHPSYNELAKYAIRITSNALNDIKTKRADYGELALLAVSKHGTTLTWVPKDRADYYEIATAAVLNDWSALRFVEGSTPGYDRLAEIALSKQGAALQYVPEERYDYGRLASIAIANNADAIWWVPERDDYYELARAAIEKDPLALKSVWWPTWDGGSDVNTEDFRREEMRYQKDAREYKALARLAITRSKGAAIAGVGPLVPDFEELLTLAVDQSSSVIDTIAKDDPIYKAALEAHRWRWPGVVPGAGPSHGYRLRARAKR